jgi:hypothetical protein
VSKNLFLYTEFIHLFIKIHLFIIESPEIMSAVEVCVNCQTPIEGKATKCGHCLVFKYCNRKCLNDNFESHKLVCPLLKQPDVVNDSKQQQQNPLERILELYPETFAKLAVTLALRKKDQNCILITEDSNKIMLTAMNNKEINKILDTITSNLKFKTTCLTIHKSRKQGFISCLIASAHPTHHMYHVLISEKMPRLPASTNSTSNQ